MATRADRPSIKVEFETKSYNAPKKNCVPLEMPGGTIRFVRITRPTDLNARRHIQARVPIYKASSFVGEAPDGVYNWIFGDKEFFAVPVFSLFEYGTLHKQIAEQSGTKEIFFAGECWKEGGGLVRFNTLSGTFTRMLVEDEEELAENINAWSTEMFESMGFSLVSREAAKRSFIREPFVSLKEDELAFYKSLGFKVELYKDEETCRGMKRSFIEAQIRQREASLKLPKLAEDIQERIKREIAYYEEQLRGLEQPTTWNGSASASASRSPKTRKRPRNGI